MQPGRRPVAGLGEPEHVGVGVGGHPLGVDEDVLDHAASLGQPGVGGVGVLRVRREAAARGVPDERQRLGQLVGKGVEAAGTGGGHRVRQRVRRLREPVGGIALTHMPLGATRRPLDVEHGELVGGRLGDP